MHGRMFIPEVFSAPSLDADALAQRTLEALREGCTPKAVRCALFFRALFPHILESHVLSAVALTKAEQIVAALDAWDAAFRQSPYQTDWAEEALRLAWRSGHDTYAAKWIALLERVFITPPSPRLLHEMEAHGWKGLGTAGVHQGYLRGWAWLPSNERPCFTFSTGGPALKIGPIQQLRLGARALNLFSFPLPPATSLFFVGITDSQGRHVQGSPVVCDPVRIPDKAKARSLPVAVIIPVYNDFRATMACLGSLFASRLKCKTAFDIVAVWDHGPDARLPEQLERLARKKKLFLHYTPRNLGFLAGINFTLDKYAHRDVVLLNADTLVHGDWLDRLRRIASRSGTATVTPFGSSAELLSFPSPSNPGEIIRLSEVRRIDNACSQICASDPARPVPVGVGFCMYIPRPTLEKLGGFDGYWLYSGYGEEVDFCLRAKEAGLKNVAACNVFVAHMGERSFGLGKKALAAQNNKALFARYPTYDQEYRHFLYSNPLRKIRERISEALYEPLQAPLHIYSHLDIQQPAVEFLRKQYRSAGRQWATLAIRSAGSQTRIRLHVEQDLPLADSRFLLPRDAARLRAALTRLNPPCVQIHSHSPVVTALADSFFFPREQPAPLSQILPDSIQLENLHDKAWLVVPPVSIEEWKALCRTARAMQEREQTFWVLSLIRYWGEAPRPVNVLPAPKSEDFYLGVDGLLAFNTQTLLSSQWDIWAREHNLAVWQVKARPDNDKDQSCA